MKRKAVMALDIKRPKSGGCRITVQCLDHNLIILNVFENKALTGRYCMNTETNEYETYIQKEKRWSRRKLGILFGLQPYYYLSYYKTEERYRFDTKEDRELLNAMVPKTMYGTGPLERIGSWEDEVNYERRDRAEYRREERIRKLMDQVPPLPDLNPWIYQLTGEKDFAFWDREKEEWTCTNCLKQIPKDRLPRVDGGKKTRHNDMVQCPHCKKEIQAKKRVDSIKIETHCIVMQNMNDEKSAATHLDVKLHWDKNGLKIFWDEAVRIILFRNYEKKPCELYYSQNIREYGYSGVHGRFDTKNPANRNTFPSFLYPEGIREALEGTWYSDWIRLFEYMAAAEIKEDYNRIMTMGNRWNAARTFEYLLKGRFHTLFKDSVKQISVWRGTYSGPLALDADSIEQTFRVADRQKINRIRDMDGGNGVVLWIQYLDRTGEKMNQKTLEWLIKNQVLEQDLFFIKDKMHPIQVMNYIEKQKQSGYKNKNAVEILNQWADYLDMCRALKKDLDDEMVYRPRELKRRHDEVVEDRRKLMAVQEMQRNDEMHQKMAEEMREKFPGAEEILEEIRERYEYRNDTFMITVPKQLIEIVKEGHALHHCGGSSERYFERILHRETYICFLRRVTEPEIPFYTIEVEPGGTIRQHRSFYDEEPGIEEIRDFLKEWQAWLKKQLTWKDRELAEVSREKRIRNIEELRIKNNTRVLNGLMEDLMEVI